MYVDPSPYRSTGVELWTDGRSYSPRVLRRTTRFAYGIFTVRPPSADQIGELADAMVAAGVADDSGKSRSAWGFRHPGRAPRTAWGWVPAAIRPGD